MEAKPATFKFGPTAGRLEIQGAVGGAEGLVEMLEEVLAFAKAHPEALAAGKGESREVTFERLRAGEFIGAAHRS